MNDVLCYHTLFDPHMFLFQSIISTFNFGFVASFICRVWFYSMEKVKIWAKSNAKINSSTSIFLQIVTILLINFSIEAILFLIYLLADKGTYKMIQSCRTF